MENKDAGGESARSQETLFDPGKVAIATHTLYPNWYPGARRSIGDTDKVRGDLALETLKAAISNGFHMILADGGSSKDFIAEVSKLEKEGVVLVTASEAGRGPQRRASFTRASQEEGVRVIVYMQPEKVPLVQEYVRAISLPILRGEADIVIPARDPELFQRSYPDYMYESEVWVNRRYNTLLRTMRFLKDDQEFDWFFGPVVFKNDPEVLALFLKKYKFILPQSPRNIDRYINPDNRSNGHYFSVVEALKRGLRVSSVQIPFVYPQEQKENESSEEARGSFARRRRTDRFGYLTELIQFVRHLEKSPKLRFNIEEG